MVSHYTPSDQTDSRKFRRTADNFEKILPFVLFEKVNTVRNPAYQMMDGFIFLYSFI